MRAAALIALVLAACGVPYDPGLEAWLRVDGAQYLPGEPTVTAEGPEVLEVQLLSTRIHPGRLGVSLQGSAGDRATGIVLRLAGDRGHWVMPAGTPDPITRILGFQARLSFSPSLPLGEHRLEVLAGDEAGRVGPPQARTLEAAQAPVAGRLVVSLSWSEDADLDLHVVDPSGAEIWARNVNSYENPRPGSPPDPNEVAKGGVLDFDSNSQCVLDGRRQENVVWQAPPPPGPYLVRVDAPSLCGQPAAHYTVQAVLDGQLLGGAVGTATQFDVDRQTHDRGSGTTVLTFDVP